MPEKLRSRHPTTISHPRGHRLRNSLVASVVLAVGAAVFTVGDRNAPSTTKDTTTEVSEEPEETTKVELIDVRQTSDAGGPASGEPIPPLVVQAPNPVQPEPDTAATDQTTLPAIVGTPEQMERAAAIPSAKDLPLGADGIPTGYSVVRKGAYPGGTTVTVIRKIGESDESPEKAAEREEAVKEKRRALEVEGEAVHSQ